MGAPATPPIRNSAALAACRYGMRMWAALTRMSDLTFPSAAWASTSTGSTPFRSKPSDTVRASTVRLFGVPFARPPRRSPGFAPRPTRLLPTHYSEPGALHRFAECPLAVRSPLPVLMNAVIAREVPPRARRQQVTRPDAWQRGDHRRRGRSGSHRAIGGGIRLGALPGVAVEFDALLTGHRLPLRGAAAHMPNGSLQWDSITGIDRVQYPDLLTANQLRLVLKIA